MVGGVGVVVLLHVWWRGHYRQLMRFQCSGSLLLWAVVGYLVLCWWVYIWFPTGHILRDHNPVSATLNYVGNHWVELASVEHVVDFPLCRKAESVHQWSHDPINGEGTKSESLQFG
jgi:hypothetical protein